MQQGKHAPEASQCLFQDPAIDPASIRASIDKIQKTSVSNYCSKTRTEYCELIERIRAYPSRGAVDDEVSAPRERVR